MTVKSVSVPVQLLSCSERCLIRWIYSTVVISNMNIIGSFHYVTKHLAQCLMCAVYVVIESLMIYYMTPRGKYDNSSNEISVQL